MSKDTDKDIDTDKLRQRFDDSVQSIDAEIASKITQARYRALEQAEEKTKRWTATHTGAVATACVLAVVFMLLPEKIEENGMQGVDLDLISSSEEFELYEDLEFYQWLEDYEVPT